MSLVCTRGQSCASTLSGPQIDQAQSVFTAPSGTAINAFNWQIDNSSNLQCFKSVRATDGSIITGTAGAVGVCPPPTNPTIATTTCSAAAKERINGWQLSWNNGGAFKDVTVLCQDGELADGGLAFTGGGASTYGPVACPGSTHYLSQVNAAGVGNFVVEGLQFVCNPLENFCIGDNINLPECISYCNAQSGSCNEAAIRTYCSMAQNFNKPACGCFLPNSQYAILQLKSPSGIVPPISCDIRCQSAQAIKPAGLPTCNIGVLCVQQGIDITAIQSTIGQGVTLSQNCSQGGGGGGGSTSTSFFKSTTFYIILAVVLLLIIVAIIVIIIVSSNSKKKKKAEAERQEKIKRLQEQQRQLQQQKRPPGR